MNAEVLASLAIMFLAFTGLFTLLFALGRAVARRLKLRVEFRPDEPAAPPAPPAAAPAWRAMVGGQRLELGGSGFAITFDPNAPVQWAYSLWTPESAVVACGGNLQALKALGQQMASDRAEFRPEPMPPMPWRRSGAGVGASTGEPR
jgi:hypothetical protein